MSFKGKCLNNVEFLLTLLLEKTIFLFASYYKVIEFFNEHLMSISLDMLLVNATVFFFSLLCSFNGKLATGSYRLETKFCVINNK